MMEPNVAGLKRVYESYFEPRKKHMDVKDAIKLCIEQTQIVQPGQEKDVVYCFGMSKMSYPSETQFPNAYYYSMKFVEFLEFIGRLAHFKYSEALGPEFKTMPLENKLEFVLDEVLATQNIQRKDPVVVNVDMSESDDEY